MPDKLEERLGDNWREPYRSMDAFGSPESAGSVAWAWIEDVAAEMRPTPALHINSCPLDSDGHVITLYDGTSLLAAATIYRDEMNFSVLIRWRTEAADEITRLKGEVERVACGARAACEDLAIAVPDNDEAPADTLERLIKVARQAIIDAGRANVRGGLMRQERDILQDELAAKQALIDELVEGLTPFALGKGDIEDIRRARRLIVRIGGFKPAAEPCAKVESQTHG